MKTTQAFNNECMDGSKVYIYNGMLLSYKSKMHGAICNNVDGNGEGHAN